MCGWCGMGVGFCLLFVEVWLCLCGVVVVDCVVVGMLCVGCVCVIWQDVQVCVDWKLLCDVCIWCVCV